MDRLTRHELKTDKFVEEVGVTVHFLDAHRGQVIRYGGIALGVVVVAAGLFYYSKVRAEERQVALYKAIETYNAPVMTTAPIAGVKFFATAAERDTAVVKELGDLAAKYSGTTEGAVATYLLGARAADQGKSEEATKYFKQAAGESNKEYASLAKFSLAQLAASEGRNDEAEKLLKELLDNPTAVVTKEQATIQLAQLIIKSKPAEAKKLLEPLAAQPGAPSRVAIELLGQITQAR